MTTSQPLPSENGIPGAPEMRGEMDRLKTADPPPKSGYHQKQKQSECVIIAPKQLGLFSRAEFRQEAVGLLDQLIPGLGRLVVDFRNTLDVDSAGLNTLAVLHRIASHMRISIVLMGMRDDLRALLAITKMEDMFLWQDAEPS